MKLYNESRKEPNLGTQHGRRTNSGRRDWCETNKTLCLQPWYPHLGKLCEAIPLLGHQDDVRRRLRADVAERQHKVVFIDYGCGNLLADDLVKTAQRRLQLLSRLPVRKETVLYHWTTHDLSFSAASVTGKSAC